MKSSEQAAKNRLTPEQREKIVHMKARGYSSRYLAGLFKVTEPSINYTVRKYRRNQAGR